MRNSVLLYVLAVCWLASLSAPAAAERIVVRAEQWQRADTAALPALSSIAPIVTAFDGAPGSRIVIRFPGGEAGTAWARDVRDNLVAMGVASRHIELQPGSGFADALVLENVQ